MKTVTEFAAFALTKANQTKAALAAEGKTPEEIQENFGQNLKLEGEKLGYFMKSLEVADANTQNLKRVIVVKLAEGEKAPAKAVQVEEICFVPEFLVEAKPVQKVDANAKGGRGRSGGGRGGKDGGKPKSSPWGLSPEEKAAKNKKPTPAS